uniref:ORF-231 n=1 Tax=Physarum polycephalum TaxID=5791 RepID=Q35591_PHYPO|nr:unassigned reading frame [Physarum polycephalum]AAC15940.1 unassigned reading frame [Physarum polycephalum]BAA06113.1 ORF-231 [Physarum polycephalum]
MNNTKITNIKLITNISPSSENLASKILSQLLPIIQSLPEKSRLRLYPYFINDSSKTGPKKNLSQKDVAALRTLTPSIVQFNEALKTYIDTYNITFGEKNNSVLRSIVNFGESLSKKVENLSINPTVDITSFSHIIDSVIQEAEASSSCILMPAFDPKILYSNQIPNNFLDQKEFTIIFTDIEPTNPLFIKPIKEPKAKKEKPVKERKSKKKVTPITDESEKRLNLIESLKE